MVEVKKPTIVNKPMPSTEPQPPTAPAPASRTVHRNADTGRLASADAVAANPKGHVSEALAAGYHATVVNVAARANGVRVTLDLDMSPAQADVLSMDGAKVRVAISV